MAASLGSSDMAPSTLTSPTPSQIQPTKEDTPPPPRPFSRRFCQRRDPEMAQARKTYAKKYIEGFLAIIITIFAVFPIYWGSLWKVPVSPLPGWIVDFDGGEVGSAVVEQLTAIPNNVIVWSVQPPSQFPDGQSQVAVALLSEETWVAVTINEGVSDRLANSIASPDPLYNGSEAITMYGAEARNENVYRTFFRPFIQTTLDRIQDDFAIQQAVNLSTATNLPTLLSVSPQTVTIPISYTIVNVVPFNQPVASAVTFVGLIYSLILSFFVVVVAYGAREASRLNQLLRYRSIVIVRLLSSITGYFFLSLFYSLLSLSFKINLTFKYGSAGFLVFWMVNWVGMLSVGLALESLVTFLTTRYVPFFMILLIIANVAVCIYPIDMLPQIFRYGYAAPFYNISQSVRSIVFGTRDRLGKNFAILIVWAIISCITLSFFQWFVRRKDVAAEREQHKKQIENQSA